MHDKIQFGFHSSAVAVTSEDLLFVGSFGILERARPALGKAAAIILKLLFGVMAKPWRSLLCAARIPSHRFAACGDLN